MESVPRKRLQLYQRRKLWFFVTVTTIIYMYYIRQLSRRKIVFIVSIIRLLLLTHYSPIAVYEKKKIISR